uniref:biotin synthase n=1 Tax=Eutreptiella gymnastica TaxID=73025 RepID=A0A7S1IPF5_9EUGL
MPVRNDWTKEEIAAIYNQPLLELMYQAATVHRQYWDASEVQQCTLLSIKTGGCPEDCGYCSQSKSHTSAFVKPTPLMSTAEVVAEAIKAKEAGSTRFCMGAAWREVSQVGPRQFQRVCDMIAEVNKLGLEVCVTLGMLNAEQAQKLKEAGLTAYNHNLDTSEEHYKNVVTTRTYEDRLKTLKNVRDAGLSTCCGGILGLGESHEDRVSLLHTLSTMETHPESVPVNALVPNEGTPMEDHKKVPVFDMVRMISSARILMPLARVRLSAGRTELNEVEQAMCFMAGANSIFTGDKLLTTPNPEFSEDAQMFQTLGLSGKAPFSEDYRPPSTTSARTVVEPTKTVAEASA